MRVFEGNTISIQGYDGGGGRGIRASLVFYNKLGFPEIVNSIQDKWNCSGLNATKTNTIMNIIKSNFESTNNYKPLDFNAGWLWGNSNCSTQNAYCVGGWPYNNTACVGNCPNNNCSGCTTTCSTTLNGTVKDSVIYVTAFSNLTAVSINGTPIPSTKLPADLGSSWITKTFDSTMTGKSLQAKDTIKFTVNKANLPSSNPSYNWPSITDANPHFGTAAGIVAVIAYKDSNGKVNVIKTGDPGWTCNDAAPFVVPFGDSYRKDFFLNSVFEASTIGNVARSADCYCSITLP